MSTNRLFFSVLYFARARLRHVFGEPSPVRGRVAGTSTRLLTQLGSPTNVSIGAACSIVLFFSLTWGGLAQEQKTLIWGLKPAKESPPTPPKPGVVFVVGGVGGWDTLPCSSRLVFPLAGVPHEIRDFVWTHGWGKFIRDLQDFRHAENKAEELAREIRQALAFEPDRRIYIVAKSGGAGVALRAAELLPPASLERLIVLAAAVSPAYDLRPALRATRGEIVAFCSPLDQFILNWGTRQFGTVDRYYGPSAGLHGFVVPQNLNRTDKALYDRLVQITWSPRMIWQGYLGGHAANSFPWFLAAEVGPWLK